MSIHKAQLKTIEELEQSTIVCCDYARHSLTESQNVTIIIDISDVLVSTGVCEKCGRRFKDTKLYRVLGILNDGIIEETEYNVIGIEDIHIDESPLTEEELRAYTTSRA